MATVKKANVPPTHPTVWVGLGLAVLGLLVATYAYTGSRVYDVLFAFVAILGALLALGGILTAAWGRSIMAARASRSRRATFKDDALALAKPVTVTEAIAQPASEDAPTIAAPREKKRFAFPMPKRSPKGERTEKPGKADKGSPAGVFAFKRREAASEPAATPEASSAASSSPTLEAPAPAPAFAPDDPRDPAVSARLDAELDAIGDLQEPRTVRVTLKCPSCGTTFSAEGVRPFTATCTSCGFSASV